jgi:hypothetical protein
VSQERRTSPSFGVTVVVQVERFPMTRFISRIVTTPPGKSTSEARARGISLRRAPVKAANATIG